MPSYPPYAMLLSEACRYAGLKSTSILEQAIRDKKLSAFAYTERGDRMILREDLEQWIRSCRIEKVVSQK